MKEGNEGHKSWKDKRKTVKKGTKGKEEEKKKQEERQLLAGKLVGGIRRMREVGPGGAVTMK